MSGKRAKKERMEAVGELEELRAKYGRLFDICQRLKAREGRLAVGMVALQVAYRRKDTLAINKFITDMLRSDLADAVNVMTERDLAMKTLHQLVLRVSRNEGLEAGEVIIALDTVKQVDPYFFYAHGEVKTEEAPKVEANA